MGTTGRRRGLTRRQRTRLLANLTGLLVFALLMFPAYWMVATAFKPGRDILRLTPQWFPVNATLANFIDAVGRPFFLEDARNSVVITLSALTISIVVAFLAAVAVARFGFRGRAAFVVIIIAVQMIPLTALIIPLYLLLDKVGQTDTLTGVILTYLILVLPFMVWTLRGFIINVPVELEEAAQIDGCTRFGAFMRVLFPLVAPGLVATSMFGFIQAWSEYIMAYVLLNSQEKQTLSVWLASFTTQRGTDWGPLMAGATLTAIPVVVFFLIVQRNVVTGLTAGAVKG
ncbi:MAG: carbohydrate ABC transporter permease [Chloroflexi bacterium]|nr:MAG: carbohydrate ABC transporter permease [Chloroflexota bacterium]